MNISKSRGKAGCAGFGNSKKGNCSICFVQGSLGQGIILQDLQKSEIQKIGCIGSEVNLTSDIAFCYLCDDNIHCIS